MLRMIIGRLFAGVIVIYLVATFAFFMLRAADGGPFDNDAALDPRIKAKLEARYKLDKSVWVQYSSFISDLSRGDLGESQTSQQRVKDIILRSAPYSIRIGAFALFFAIIVGIIAGVVAASRQNTAVDHTSMAIALFGISIPSFVLAFMLIYVFSVRLGWFPAVGLSSFKHVILPGATLGMIYMGVIARLTRSGMLDTLRQDYIRTARAKGLSERKVVWKHAFRLGVMPVVTYLGPAIAALITGSFVVEQIFQIPGLGRYFIEGALNRDAPLLAGVLVVYSIFLILLNLLVDIAYGFIDPRIRAKR